MRSLIVALALVVTSSAFAQSGATPLRTNKTVRTNHGAKLLVVTPPVPTTEVTAIRQDEQRVTVSFQDRNTGDNPQTASADWCICTIPLSVLSQMEIDVSTAMANAIRNDI